MRVNLFPLTCSRLNYTVILSEVAVHVANGDAAEGPRAGLQWHRLVEEFLQDNGKHRREPYLSL
jgi:hypothetical protein